MRWLWLVAFASLASISTAQTLRWAAPLDIVLPTGTEAVASLPGSNGTQLIFGNRETGMSTYPFVRILDRHGNLLVDRNLPLVGLSDHDVSRVVPDGLGGAYLAIRSGAARRELRIVRVDGGGNLLWARTVARDSHSVGDTPVDLVASPNFGVGVLVWRNGVGPSQQVVMRFLPSGTLLWSVISPTGYDQFNPKDLDLSGDVLVAATTIQSSDPAAPSRIQVTCFSLETGQAHWTNLFDSGFLVPNERAFAVRGPSPARQNVALIGTSTNDEGNRAVSLAYFNTQTGVQQVRYSDLLSAHPDLRIVDTDFLDSPNRFAILFRRESEHRVMEVANNSAINTRLLPAQADHVAYVPGSSSQVLLVDVHPDGLVRERLDMISGNLETRAILLPSERGIRQVEVGSDGLLTVSGRLHGAATPMWEREAMVFRFEPNLDVFTAESWRSSSSVDNRGVSAVDAAGNAYLYTVGSTYGAGSLDRAVVAKMSPAGVVLWRVALPASAALFNARVHVGADGTVTIAGSDANNVFRALKLNGSNGRLLWQVRPSFPSTSTEVLSSQLAANGDLLLAGSALRTRGLGDSLVGRLRASNGSVAWMRLYNSPDHGHDYANDVAELSDGSVATVGKGGNAWQSLVYSASGTLAAEVRTVATGQPLYLVPDGAAAFYVVGFEMTGAAGRDIAVRRYGANGTDLWARSVRYNFANRTDMPLAAVVDSVGILTIAGVSQTAGATYQAVALQIRRTGTYARIARHSTGTGHFDRFVAATVDAQRRVWLAGMSRLDDPARPTGYVMRLDPNGARTAPVVWRPSPSTLSVTPVALHWRAPNQLTLTAVAPRPGTGEDAWVVRFQAP